MSGLLTWTRLEQKRRGMARRRYDWMRERPVIGWNLKYPPYPDGGINVAATGPRACAVSRLELKYPPDPDGEITESPTHNWAPIMTEAELRSLAIIRRIVI